MKIKLWYKRLTCKHERRVRFYPENVMYKNMTPEMDGWFRGIGEEHPTIAIEGCLDCHKMWIRDYGE